jgi:hypothetical protein
MILRPILFALTASMIAIGEEKTSPPPTVTLPIPLQIPTGQAWLGLKIAKADPTTTAHIPALPPGIGFIIKSIDEGGPAHLANLAAFDVLWKMGDQLLVNEAQLATLLRLSKPGDEVKLSIFRAGQLMEIKLKLGDMPIGKDGFSNDLAENAILPSEGSPMRVINVAERTATYSTEEGKAVLRREGDAYLVVIRSKSDVVIFEGDVTEKSGFINVPKEWQRRVWALKRGLDHAIEGNMVPVRPPRPRVVTQPSARE